MHLPMETEFKSKSQKKREDRALQALALELAQLPAAVLAGIELPEAFREALAQTAGLSGHGARRRHRLHLGSLLRGVDPAPLQAALEAYRRGDPHQVRVFQTVERWRDALREGRLDVVEEILARCPQADRQRLTQLARHAGAEARAGRGVKSSRALFRYLSALAGGEIPAENGN
jgi:ribosome-associated protein